MAHAYTTKRGKNKKSKLGVRKDQQQNMEKQLKCKPDLHAHLYDGPKESAAPSIGRLANSSINARLESVKARLAKALMDKCSFPECQNASDSKTLSECSACRQARYCSRECQKAHWPNHKEQCKAARKALEAQEAANQQKLLSALQELGLDSTAAASAATDGGEEEATSLENINVEITAESSNPHEKAEEGEEGDDGEEEEGEEEEEEDDLD
jgi:hypothetical protein